MGESTRPSEAGERALRLLATLEPSGAQPHVNGSAAKVLIRDGWLTGVKGSYTLTVKARNFLAGVVDTVEVESRGVPAANGYGYVKEYRGTCQHGVQSAWFPTGGEAMDAARDHGNIDDQPHREPSDSYAADHDTRQALATRAMSIGYTGEGAFDLAERAYYVGNGAPCGDECGAHPGIRCYSNGQCEACEVVRQWLASAAEPVAEASPVAVPAERPCALVCGPTGTHNPLCPASRDLICQADFRTGYCVLPIHDGNRHRDMYGNWVDVATTRRLGDPEPTNPVTHAMNFAVREWERHATFADTSMLANMIAVMDGVNGLDSGTSEQARLFDAGTGYGMLLMCRTVVGTVIGPNHTVPAEAYVIDHVRRMMLAKRVVS